MYPGLDNLMMLVYEGGADTSRSLSSYSIIPEFEEIQVLEEFRPEVSRGPDAVTTWVVPSRTDPEVGRQMMHAPELLDELFGWALFCAIAREPGASQAPLPLAAIRA